MCPSNGQCPLADSPVDTSNKSYSLLCKHCAESRAGGMVSSREVRMKVSEGEGASAKALRLEL